MNVLPRDAPPHSNLPDFGGGVLQCGRIMPQKTEDSSGKLHISPENMRFSRIFYTFSAWLDVFPGQQHLIRGIGFQPM
jgi:hypothetical protein